MSCGKRRAVLVQSSPDDSSQRTITLYHAPKSRSFRTLWLLEELGIPYATKIASIRRGDGSDAEEDPNYRKIHPHAKVPAIVHDGVAVFEAPAIAVYLTDAFPTARLGPRIGEPTRGPYLTWLAYLTGVFEPALIAKSIGVPHRHGGFGWAPAEDVEALLARTLENRPYLRPPSFRGACSSRTQSAPGSASAPAAPASRGSRRSMGFSIL